MKAKFAAEVARYETLAPEHLAALIGEFRRMLSAQQSMLAAALKAQKNQRKAEKIINRNGKGGSDGR